MSAVAGLSKKPKTYHFHTEWEEDFFLDYVIFQVRLPHLSVCHCYSKEEKCGAGFSDSS